MGQAQDLLLVRTWKSAWRRSVLFCFLLLVALGCGGAGKNWWQGNLHTHSLWSDGDDYPEMVVDWYKSNGYHFLAISDHNILSDHDKWVDLEQGRAHRAYEAYEKRFGPDWAEKRTLAGKQQIKLKTLAEIEPVFAEPNRFLLIQSEEISDRFESKPIHVNATNILERIEPQGGQSVLDVMQNNVNAVLEQMERTGQPMLPHINHPNYGWAVSAADLIALQGDHFFELYNGHPLVHNYGDSLRSGMEAIWDVVLSARLAAGRSILYGIAVDDAHNYHDTDSRHSNPGRAWIMVRSHQLSSEALIEAMVSGDFYASTGVMLDNIEITGEGIEIKIAQQPGIQYETHFIGIRPAAGGESPDSDQLGALLQKVVENPAIYRFAGDEVYVRAKIISSKPKTNPYRSGEVEVAWTQPAQPQPPSAQ